MSDFKPNITNRTHKAEPLVSAMRRSYGLPGQEPVHISPAIMAPAQLEPLMPLNPANNASVFIQALRDSGEHNYKLYLNNRAMFYLELDQKTDRIVNMYKQAQGIDLIGGVHSPLGTAIQLNYDKVIKLKVRVSRPMLDHLYNSMEKATKEALLEKSENGKESPGYKSLRLELKRLRDLRKAIPAYHMLKAIEAEKKGQQQGFINTPTAWAEVGDKLHASKNTMLHRRTLLVSLGMAYTRGQSFFLYSTGRAGAAIGCPGADFNYKYVHIVTNLKTFEYATDLIWEKEKKMDMKHATKMRINHKLTQEERIELSAICGCQPSKLNRAIIKDAQILAFTRPDSVQRKYAAALFTININDNPGYRKLSRHFSYTSKGGLAYRKRKWMQLGLANIFHQQFTDPTHQVRPKDTYPCATSHYSRPHKATMLRYTDKIDALC